MAKKKTTHSRKHITSTDTHFLLRKSLFIYSLIVFVAFVLVSASAYTFVQLAEYRTSHTRLNEISSIYSSLNLDESYRIAKSDVFGDKREYSWDSSRSFSSSVEYGKNASVSATFSDLKNRIQLAGFEQIEGPNYGPIARQDHYKNSDGQYIRVSVESKAWHDAILYGLETPAPQSPDASENGPVYVTIRVNLDDNNE